MMGPQLPRPAPVPVVVFAYRRPEQLERTLECLRGCGVEQLYVFSDGPGDAAAVEDVEACEK